MDDKRFDDLIKNKVEGFIDTGHDANALTDLRARLSNMPVKNSRWSNGKLGYLAGAMVLFTLMNYGIIWYFNEGRYDTPNTEIAELKEERSRIISLQNELSFLKTQNNYQSDTIYIYRDLPTTANSGITLSTLYSSKSVSSEMAPADTEEDINYTFGEYHILAKDPDISLELGKFLKEHNLLLSGDQGEMILVVNQQPTAPSNNYSFRNSDQPMGPGMPENLSDVSTYQPFETPFKKPEKKRIPAKMIWAMEKHNYKGIDFQFGIEGRYYKNNYDVGSGTQNGGFGVMAEAIFSPILRLETGIQVGNRGYNLGENEINQLPPDFFTGYPGYDDQLGELSTLETDAQLIKLPLNLKVFGILDHNKKWYLSAGLTPQWASKQEFDYKYALTTPDSPITGDDYITFVGSKQEVPTAFYTTTANLGVGTEIYLNEKLRWQLGLFYQKGLSKAGYENRKLESSFGVKSSIWFNRP